MNRRGVLRFLGLAGAGAVRPYVGPFFRLHRISAAAPIALARVLLGRRCYKGLQSTYVRSM